jgi:carboxyl-terminal processing protease
MILAAGAALLVLLMPPGDHRQAAAQDTVGADTFKALDLFGEVFERVRQEYVEPVSDQKLIESALNGMLTSLDPHSSYLNAKEYADMQVSTEGEFGGLGIEVTQDNGLIKIISPMDDTPGSRAGLKPGDYIVALNGKLVVNMSLDDAVNQMRGPPNTQVKLSIRRGNAPPFDVTLTRAVIHLTSVKGQLMRGNIAYLRVSSFSGQTGDELRKAYANLKKQAGANKLTGVVLDLRNNPGGLLDASVSVAGAFLNQGEVVSTRGRKPDDIERFSASDHDITGGLPMVVLINGGTASAAEIVSGALQDHHRAVILGTRSFGKGSVQTIIPLPSNGGAIRLTTARYYTPSGRSIQAEGIVPDIVVEQAKIEAINAPAYLRESDLKGALKNTGSADSSPANDNTASGNTSGSQVNKTTTIPSEPAVVPSQAKPPAKNGTPGKTPASPAPGASATPAASTTPEGPAADDYQLTRALDLIKGIALFAGHAGK